ncbi:hypothetical protein GQ457_04G003360 [Hibiscus cannabinus]
MQTVSSDAQIYVPIASLGSSLEVVPLKLDSTNTHICVLLQSLFQGNCDSLTRTFKVLDYMFDVFFFQ